MPRKFFKEPRTQQEEDKLDAEVRATAEALKRRWMEWYQANGRPQCHDSRDATPRIRQFLMSPDSIDTVN